MNCKSKMKSKQTSNQCRVIKLTNTEIVLNYMTFHLRITLVSAPGTAAGKSFCIRQSRNKSKLLYPLG